MYKKKFSILVALLIVLMVSGAAQAANTNLFSVENTSGNEIYIDSTGVFYGAKASTEAATTNDTVTAAESGKTFLIDPGVTYPLTMTLPVAAAGLEYTFTAVNGMQGSSTPGRIYLDPNIADTFVGCVNSLVTSTFAAGDSLYSPGATGDTVTIVGASTKWYCTNRVGTWVDGNTTK